MIEILNRWTRVVLYRSEAANNLRDAALEALRTRADLTDADLTRADLRGANLTDADLTRADLRGANLTGANLTDADLRDADLTRADLRGANLTGANLTDADLRDADLTDADLRGADLTRADLRGANLTDADLRGANLTDADLRGANLTDADLRGANCLAALGGEFICLRGSRHPIIALDEERISIGCMRNSLAWWREHCAAVGRSEDYTDAQVEEYRLHIEYVAAWLANRKSETEAIQQPVSAA